MIPIAGKVREHRLKMRVQFLLLCRLEKTGVDALSETVTEFSFAIFRVHCIQCLAVPKYFPK
jgi:hypothetical protein